MKTILAAAIAVGAAVPAMAGTINLSLPSSYVFASYDASGNQIANNVSISGPNAVTNNDAAFYTATATFKLTAAGAAAAKLFANGVVSDDRTVLQLNGSNVGGAGIFGGQNGGVGRFFFAPTGGAVDFTFQDNGANFAASAPFAAGLNTVSFIVNNTNNGIFGDDRTSGPSQLAASVAIGVPEPAQWAMMVGGFGLLGAAARRRRTTVTYA